MARELRHSRECLSANHGLRTRLAPVLALAPYEAFAIACTA